MHVQPGTATVSNRVGRAIPGMAAPLKELFDGVDDLIKRVADTENPEIRKIRAKVHASMAVAKTPAKKGALVGVGLGVIMSAQP